MTYVMSDIHGQFQKYKKMLETISFSEKDELYILGDVVDRGPNPVAVLMDMSMRSNVFPIMGNHDMTAAFLLRKLCAEITEDNCDTQLDAELLKGCAMWQVDGGETTLEGFRRLNQDTREALIEYMEDFSPYELIEVGGRRFLLVHGGVPYDKRHIPMDEQELRDLITERPDYTKQYFSNVIMVTGHTPTVAISRNSGGKIYHVNGHIAIDCGAGFDMQLGCLRLDDFREFYV